MVSLGPGLQPVSESFFAADHANARNGIGSIHYSFSGRSVSLLKMVLPSKAKTRRLNGALVLRTNPGKCQMRTGIPSSWAIQISLTLTRKARRRQQGAARATGIQAKTQGTR